MTPAQQGMPPRFTTTWPLNLQPTFGSSQVDWTKVDVVPAAYYDTILADYEAALARLRVAVGALKGIANGANGERDPVLEDDALAYGDIEEIALIALRQIGEVPK